MISFLSGTLAETGDRSIVVETGGVGFFVTVPSTLLDGLPPIGSAVRVYTHFHVSEDAIKLYGFKSREDREVFRLLIGISGIGPKVAIGVLSVMEADALKLAVLSNDEKRISRAPGLGPKTAKKIILELKDKFKLGDIGEYVSEGSAVPAASGAREDAMEALIALGYSPSESLSLISRLSVTPEMTSDEILSLALRQKLS